MEMEANVHRLRQRVQHKEYRWMGDVLTIARADSDGAKWYRVAWDNNEVSTEHEDDISLKA